MVNQTNAIPRAETMMRVTPRCFRVAAAIAKKLGRPRTWVAAEAMDQHARSLGLDPDVLASTGSVRRAKPCSTETARRPRRRQASTA